MTKLGGVECMSNFEHSVGRELLSEKGVDISHKTNSPKPKFDMTND